MKDYIMFYEFPVINNINDVLEVIEGNSNFSVLDKGFYKVIVYNAMGNDTFPDIMGNDTKIFRELRGIIFRDDGEVLSRPYQKFFNINEREETHISNIDFSQPHIILEKLDGSMVRPFYTDKECTKWRLATKRGITDVSNNAESFVALNENYHKIIGSLMVVDFTPIFEWCSRKNRIVIDYPQDRLVLTAIRDNKNGKYFSYEKMVNLAKKYDIDYVKAIVDTINKNNINEFLEYTRNLEGQEGFVIRFDNGHMCKVKADDYVKVHRAISNFDSERNIIKLILDEKLDDLKPLLDINRRNYLEDFETNFWRGFNISIANCYSDYSIYCSKGFTKRDFAIQASGSYDPPFRAIMFALYDHKDLTEFVKTLILTNTSSNIKLDRVRVLYGNIIWSMGDFHNGEIE